MFKGRKVVVVMPAYNAAKTVTKTYEEVIEEDLVDLIILVDDRSRDETVAVARELAGFIWDIGQLGMAQATPRSE